MIYILFGMILMCFIIDYMLEKDFFSPTAILCESYMLAIFLAILNIDKWNIQFHWKTFTIIILGILVFFITSFFIKKLLNYKKREIECENLELIRIKKYASVLINLFQLFILIAYINSFESVVGEKITLDNFSGIMTEYRNNLAYGNGYDKNIPSILNQLTKISKANMYISLYIFIHNNIVSKKKGIKDVNSKLGYIMSIVLYIPLIILSSGRFELIIFILAGLIIWYILQNYFGDKTEIGLKKLIKIILIILICLFVFSSTRTLVGRTNTSSMVDYIASYFGGAIQLLNLYIENPISESEIFGQETFVAINKTLYKLGVLDREYKIYLEFRSSNGIVIGNVYTALRSYIQDFGILGMIFMQVILSGIITILYENVKKTNLNKVSILLIFYAISIHSIFLHAYSEFFFNTILSINYIVLFICIYIVKKFIVVKNGKSEK